IGKVLPSVMKLEAKTYQYIDNPANAGLSYGFIAQDVEKIFPDFVSTKGPDGMKAIAYEKLNIIAIKAIQEQQQQIETLKSTVEKLEKAVEALMKK
ncbi:MAG: tail fiber domain-containing protein, partial [Ginsengibacter sp.]